MRIYIANSKYGETIVASRHPFKQDADGFIDYSEQPDNGRHINSIDLETKLARSEGAIVAVRLTPRKGYTPTHFVACTEGVRAALGTLPTKLGEGPDGDGKWVVYTKVLKRQMAPRPVDF